MELQNANGLPRHVCTTNSHLNDPQSKKITGDVTSWRFGFTSLRQLWYPTWRWGFRHPTRTTKTNHPGPVIGKLPWWNPSHVLEVILKGFWNIDLEWSQYYHLLSPYLPLEKKPSTENLEFQISWLKLQQFRVSKLHNPQNACTKHVPPSWWALFFLGRHG